MADGIVYVLTNPAMPKMVKIGRTGNDIDTRLSQLYSTGVPLPFECAYAARVADMDAVEKAFHNAFGPYRVNPKREFFSIEPEQAIGLLELMKLEDMTPTIQQEAEQVDVEAKAAAEKFKKARRPNLRFTKLGIPEGAVLQFTQGDQTCTVVSRKHVEYDGQHWSMSALAQHLTGITRPLRGSSYFTYEGELLSDLYDEAYAEND